MEAKIFDRVPFPESESILPKGQTISTSFEKHYLHLYFSISLADDNIINISLADITLIFPVLCL